MKQNDKGIVVEIRDEGVCISEESKPRIFEKFYQGDTSHFEDEHGLRLYIVKRIVEICNGTINFESNESEGVCFVVILFK